MNGAAQAEGVGDQGLEERPGLEGGTKHQGRGDLDLATRQLPPVAGGPVGGSLGQRQP